MLAEAIVSVVCAGVGSGVRGKEAALPHRHHRGRRQGLSDIREEQDEGS